MAATEDLAFIGVVEQAELVRRGDVSSRELTELTIERITRLDPQLNAFRVVLAERAIEEAERADQRRASGEAAPLLGVPIAVKDNVDVAGEVTTHGTTAYGGAAIDDARRVRRLREAGAVIVGKTNLPELAIWPFTESEGWGVTRNPWDVKRSPGGSRAARGAAVASGMVGVAHASDGGGSIRIPAACCGLFGLKPQRGRVSMMPDAEHWYGLSVFGCLSRTVRDAALFLDVVRGHVDGDAHTAPEPSISFAEAAGPRPASCGSRSRQSRSRRYRSRTWSKRRSTTPPISCGRSATTCASRIRAGASSCRPGSALPRRDPRRREPDGDPARLEQRTRRLVGFGERLRKRPLRRALRAEQKHARPPRSAVARVRRADDADDGVACRSRPTAGRARARPRRSAASRATCRSRHRGT